MTPPDDPINVCWLKFRGREASMSKLVSTLGISALVPGLVLAACTKNEEQAPPQTPYQEQSPAAESPSSPGYGQSTPGYGQAPPPAASPGYGQTTPSTTSPGYGQAPPSPGYGQTTTTPTPAPTGTMSTPGAGAFPCQTDAQCLTHRCNAAAGRCAWPCQSNDDCMPGNQCMAPMCVPALGASPAQ